MSNTKAEEFKVLEKYLRENGSIVMKRVLNVVDQLVGYKLIFINEFPADFSAFKDFVLDPSGLEPEGVLFCAILNLRFKNDISKELFACRFTYPLLYEALCITGTYANGFYKQVEEK